MPLPWLLAGGLTQDDVAEAVKIVAPASSTFLLASMEPGVKSIDLIHTFSIALKAL